MFWLTRSQQYWTWRHTGTDSIMVSNADCVNLATLQVGDPAAAGGGATAEKSADLVLHGGSEGYHASRSQPTYQCLVLLTVQQSLYISRWTRSCGKGKKLVTTQGIRSQMLLHLHMSVCVIPVSAMMVSLTELLHLLLDAITTALYVAPQRSLVILQLESIELQV